MKVSCKHILLVALLLVSQASLIADEYMEGSFGERPPVNLESIPSDAYEPGKIRIQVSQKLLEIIQTATFDNGIKGYLKLGHAELDELNRDFEVTEYRTLFHEIFEAYQINDEHRQRHEAWGLNRWFELELAPQSDIRSAVKRFSALTDIIVAEPEYRKHLVVDDPEFTSKSNETLPYNILSLPSAPNDQHFGNQWHYHNTGQQNGTPGADINLLDAWVLESGNADVIVAIIDGGIQTNHPDLAGNMWSGSGYNFVNGNTTIIPHNHGTHVAGTVAAVTNNSTGVAGVAGGSGSGNGVRLMSCQVFTNTGSGGFHTAPVWAADNGAAISQNSWGYTQAGVYEVAVLNAIDYFNTHGGGDVLDGGLTVFAAGNSNSSGQWYPACYSGAYAVAATNNQDIKTWYSNYGSWINVSAPGGETNAVTSRGVLSTLTNNLYGYYQGTSMACPHVSGVAALVLSYAARNGLVLSNTQLKNIINNTTDNHYGQNQGFTGQLGTGRVNAGSALLEVQDMLSGILNPSPFNSQNAGPHQINLNWLLNATNNQVILATSATDSFGVPVAGNSYNVGDDIVGGGTILYRGSNTSYFHTALQQATTYHYRIWSFNADYEYSSGRSKSATTECGMFSTLPFVEDFNTGSDLPGCWEILDHQGNGQVWKFGVFSHKVSGTTGNVAYLNSDAYGSGNSQNSDLISPVFDFSEYTDVTLSFKHYFRQFNSTSSATLAYSINNGASWVNIQTWTSTTPNPSTFNQLIPEVAGQTGVRFKWNYIGSYSYYWSIDDVEINGIPITPSASFSANITEVFPGDTVVFVEEIGSSSYSTLEWNFGNGAVPATAIGNGPHQVYYETSGYKTVSLTIDGTITETKEDYIHVLGLYTLSIGISGTGNVLVNNEPYSEPLSFPEGTTIILQALGDETFAFAGWSGELSGFENPHSLLMNNDKSVVANFSHFASATYTEGHIPTDLAFQINSDYSSCPGILEIPLPYIAQITSVSLSYQMTAAGSGLIADQRSQLRCVSPGGTLETIVYEGTGSLAGIYQYHRTGLDIANNVIGIGKVIFELHAGRMNGGDGCSFEHNFVENQTWSVMVFYDLVPGTPTVQTLPSESVTSNSVQLSGMVLCCGGTSFVQRGFYYSTDPELAGSGNQLEMGEGTGEYSCTVDGLLPSTTYYYKAYATNEYGTVYGDSQSFTTGFPPGLSEIVELVNLYVNENQDTCYSATQQIIVAGNGSHYTVENGGFAELVAGEKIVFLPGTHIKLGGNLLGRIAMNGDYCSLETSLPASIDNNEISPENPILKDTTISFYKLYPNPVRTWLHFELASDFNSEKAILNLYGMLGERMLTLEFYEQGNYTLDLSALPAGLYIVHIRRGNVLFVEKIIKQ